MNIRPIKLSRPLAAHLSMLGACVSWGLMAPMGNDAMTHGLSSVTMVSLRILGGASLFWLTSLFLPRERVSGRDCLLLAGASVLGLICNQCCYTIGLGITSPSNASIMTTSMPIFAMILSFAILREPITWMKGGGVALGCMGAIALVMTSAASGISARAWMEVGFVVFFGTFVAYILTMVAQQTLRPTVVSVYNYVQPLVAVSVSVAVGLATFSLGQAMGALLVFAGVALVTKSKSKRDMELAKAKEKEEMKHDEDS